MHRSKCSVELKKIGMQGYKKKKSRKNAQSFNSKIAQKCAFRCFSSRSDRFPGQRVDDFSLQDLREGLVHYVDSGELERSALGLRVAVRGVQGNAVAIDVETFFLQVLEVRACEGGGGRQGCQVWIFGEGGGKVAISSRRR